MHYFKMHMKDWKAKTCHLSVIEEGIYFRLIMHYLIHMEPIENDLNKISRKLMLVDHKKELSQVLEEFFTLEGGFWKKDKLEGIIDNFKKKSTKNSNSGKLGGRGNKRNESETKANEKRNALEVKAKRKQTESETKALLVNQEPLTINQEPLTINQEKKKNSKEDSARRIFEYWLETFGGKKSKLTAKRKKMIMLWLKDYNEETLKDCIKGCSRSSFHMGMQEGRPDVYNSIETIFKPSSNPDRFLQYLPKKDDDLAKFSQVTQKNIKTIQDVELNWN